MKDFYLEIRDQYEEKWAEGTSEERPTKKFIRAELKKRGWTEQYIKINYDDFQKNWTFVAGFIERIEK